MRALLLLSLLLVSACGFSSVYGTQTGGKGGVIKNATTAQTLFNDIQIAIIPNREGQFLRNALMDRFYSNGQPNNPRYTLKINPIKETTYNFDTTVDSEATRRQLKLNTNMTLIDNQISETVLTRSLLSISSYNVLQSEFSTIVTEQSARENALNDLARQIERQLSLAL